jgi:hypothetical protein
MRPALPLAGVLAAAGLVAAGCAGAGPAAQPAATAPRGGAAATPPLVPWAMPPVTFVLHQLSSCRVGDSLTIVRNQAAQPVRVTGVAIDLAAGSPGHARATFALAAVRPGASTAEIADTFGLLPLRSYPLRAAAGSWLAPTATSGLSYDIIARILVWGADPQPWQLTGLTVSYRLGRRSFRTVFPQHVRLPPVKCPAEPLREFPARAPGRAFPRRLSGREARSPSRPPGRTGRRPGPARTAGLAPP